MTEPEEIEHPAHAHLLKIVNAHKYELGFSMETNHGIDACSCGWEQDTLWFHGGYSAHLHAAVRRALIDKETENGRL